MPQWIWSNIRSDELYQKPLKFTFLSFSENLDTCFISSSKCSLQFWHYFQSQKQNSVSYQNPSASQNHSYWPLSLSIEPIAYRPLSLLTIEPTDHWAYQSLTYQPLCILTIKPIDHQAYRPSSLFTIKPIDHQAYQPLVFFRDF